MSLGYDRTALKTGIVHIGVGAFHRAHQALYTHRAIQRSGGDWGICGVSLRSARVRDALAGRGNVYSVAVRSPTGTELTTVGALTRVLVGPEDPGAVIEAIADPGVHVVTLTITEKGYCLAPASGRLDLDHPDILADRANPQRPCSAIGCLAAGLLARSQRGVGGLTLISCDNLAGNGSKLKDAVLTLAAAEHEGLARWIEAECRFPNSMVDRIVPAVSEADLTEVADILGQPDPAAVVTEPFSQWVIERNFAGPVPDWDRVGVAFVPDVGPFEQMKLRLLNASHSTMAYLGCLAGHDTVAEVVADPAFRALIQTLMADEMAPTLAGLEAFDLDAYQNSLLERFGNPSLPHLTRQIAMDGSQKIPQRLLPAINERLNAGLPATAAICGLAGWICYVSGQDGDGATHPVDDPLADTFVRHYRASNGDPATYLDRVLGMDEVFSSHLASSAPLRAGLLEWLQAFHDEGVKAAVANRWPVRR